MVHGVELGGGRLGEAVEIVRRLDRAQRGDNAGAREIARLMPTHAIGDRPNTYAGAEIRAVEKRILVALPDQPNMGQPM